MDQITLNPSTNVRFIVENTVASTIVYTDENGRKNNEESKCSL